MLNWKQDKIRILQSKVLYMKQNKMTKTNFCSPQQNHVGKTKSFMNDKTKFCQANFYVWKKLNQTLAKSFDKEKHGSCSGRPAASAEDDDDDDTEDDDKNDRRNSGGTLRQN